MKTYKLSSILFLIFLLPLKSWSQKNNAVDDEEIYKLFDVSLEEIMNVGMVSASQKKQSVLEAPANAYVFTEEQIEVRGFNNLLELINTIPEVEIQTNSNPEYRHMVTFRGIPGSEKFLILQNGIRITPATGDFYTLGQNYSLINVKRVEVILGPASALYGVDAFSGIINIITKNQEDESFEGGYIKAGGGNYNTTNTSFLAATRAEQLKITLSGNYYQTAEPDYQNLYPNNFAWYNNQFKDYGNVVESPYYPSVYNVKFFEENGGSRFEGASISQEFEMPTTAYAVNLELGYKDFSVGFIQNSEKHSSSYGVNPKFTAYDKEAYMKTDLNVFYIQHRYTSPNKKWNLSSNINYSNFEIDPLSHFASAASRWQRGYVYTYSQSTKIQEQFQVEASKKWSITTGISFENISSLPRTAPSPTPIDQNQPLSTQPIYYMGAGGYPNYEEGVGFNDSLAVRQQLYQINYQNYGFYLQANWAASKAWDFTLGARYDYNTRYGSTINPRIGVVIKPARQLHIKALMGTSFLAPSPAKSFSQAGAFYLYDNQTGEFGADYFRFPNPDLEPEQLTTSEVSINYFITSNFSFSTNAFYTQVTNLINPYGNAFDPPLGMEDIYGTKQESSVNEGTSEFYGVTTKLNYLYTRNKFRFNPYIGFALIDGGYSNFGSENDVPNEYDYLFYQSYLTLKGGVDIIISRLSLSLQYINKDHSRSNIKDVTGFNYDNYFGYDLLNLNFRYKFFSRGENSMTFYLKINNVLDNRYYNVYAGNEEGLPITPQDPIRFLSGIQFKF
ncbi:MAG: TonB-dependent receptor [Cyclobacteriaceae bacterium]|nr:TonB-dependent receptor [Cyclobacteriaceae bacterium]